MGNKVFANTREISCKAAAGKTICAFPDVCFTPPDKVPPTPPGIPIPYPNTGMASDTTKGSKKVVISSKEIILKNKSYFKKSMGDEAGCAQKKGIITSKTTGKVYFQAWSMDIKVEGKNVARHLDMTTNNHASMPGDTPPWPYMDSMAFDSDSDSDSDDDTDSSNDSDSECKKLASDIKGNCEALVKKTKGGKVKRSQSVTAMCNDTKCAETLKCVLTKKSPSNCCPQPQTKPPKQTPHHIVPASQFKEIGEGGGALLKNLDGESKYNYNAAPCICAGGISHSVGKHGQIHAKTNVATRKAVGVPSGKQIPADKRWEVSQAESVGAKAVHEVTGCDEGCTKEQVRNGHKTMGIAESDDIRPTTAGGEGNQTGVGFP